MQTCIVFSIQQLVAQQLPIKYNQISILRNCKNIYFCDKIEMWMYNTYEQVHENAANFYMNIASPTHKYVIIYCI